MTESARINQPGEKNHYNNKIIHIKVVQVRKSATQRNVKKESEMKDTKIAVDLWPLMCRLLSLWNKRTGGKPCSSLCGGGEKSSKLEDCSPDFAERAHRLVAENDPVSSRKTTKFTRMHS